jgi:hypothetical protein
MLSDVPGTTLPVDAINHRRLIGLRDRTFTGSTLMAIRRRVYQRAHARSEVIQTKGLG